MQASPAWKPPAGTLGGILLEARARAAALQSRHAELERAAASVKTPRPFTAALRRDTVSVIAEVKRRSPSRGWIRQSLSAADQAAKYQTGGAAAISVLTEPRHFAGSAEDLIDVREAVQLPTLKKDFHVAPIQLLEAKALGASAALLIARALDPSTLREMMREARELSLEVLVEVRDERELEFALGLDASLLGINNRDLETLAIDAATSERLLSVTPMSAIVVAESGIGVPSDVERVASGGADAVLVGSTVSAADDPVAAVRALTGVPRVSRAR